MGGLNPEQREAVEALDGPVLVLAGAGTGKTRVLTTRIAHILASRKAYPGQVLAVTFTNKAAREMKERIGDLVGGVVEGMPWLGTFHSIGVKILRRHAELVGLKSGFTILDTDDQIRLMKQVIEAEGSGQGPLAGASARRPDRRLEEPRAHARQGAGGRGLCVRRRQRRAALRRLPAAPQGAQRLRLRRSAARVLAAVPGAIPTCSPTTSAASATSWSTSTRTPTSPSTCGCELLAQGSPNICCVGDDDQSIYGWRGAEVDNILRFETDFPGAKVIRLERNYRSTGHILAAASGLIADNKGRLGKTLFTDGQDGDKVTVTGRVGRRGGGALDRR